MKKLILIVFILAITLGFVYVNKSIKFDPTKITNYPPDGKKVVAYGDSLVSGVGSNNNGGFVTILSESIGIDILNLGRGGDTTVDGLERLETVISLDPDVVLLLFGGNDFLSRVDEEAIFHNLETIVSKLHNSGSIVILLGIQGGLISDGYKRDFRNLAQEKGTAYISNVLKGILGDSNLMDDAIHPNDKGYAIIAGRIEPILLDLLNL